MVAALEPTHKMVATTTPSQVTVDLPEPSQVTVDLPEPSQVTVDLPEPSQVTVDLPEPRHISADRPESSHITSPLIFQSLATLCLTPQSHVLLWLSYHNPPLFCWGNPSSNVRALPIMGVTLWCTWAAYITAESPEVAAYAAEPHEVVVLASATCMVVASSDTLSSYPESATESVDELLSCLDPAAEAVCELLSIFFIYF
ncbi:hypothetical protein DPX16_0218 [Anabarilius grahami]|uniref:Uncharacterized protein n=1 Tax=Anabarilius grahami TaxID=495550 RepID=A0A3N0YPF5_ANAGA|nr:hypothetical protein DPX16_0218 [Anabarilius grahami]